MEVGYRDKKLSQSLTSLKKSGLSFEEPRLSWVMIGSGEQVAEPPGELSRMDEVFRIPLSGSLNQFDIALLPNGLMSLREYQVDTMNWRVLFYQTNPGHIVDLARDLAVGSSCVHLQEKKTRDENAGQ
jgi:SNF2 family DNA or RNA helicase